MLRQQGGIENQLKYGEAFKWPLKSAENGNTDAMLLVSDMYKNGLGTKADRKKSEEWHNKAQSEQSPEQ